MRASVSPCSGAGGGGGGGGGSSHRGIVLGNGSLAARPVVNIRNTHAFTEVGWCRLTLSDPR
jgi:hypothetical protein